jgi:predicted anti-sigma-YlaC factor YlaD
MARPLKMSCKEASRLLSQAMDQDLPLWERVRLRLHLVACDACRNFSRQLEFLRRAVARLID